MNRYFSVDQPDSRLLFSMAHDGSSWEGFIFLSPPPEAKSGEQDRLLRESSFTDGVVFFAETALVVARGFQTLLMSINDPVNRCLK